MSRKALLTIIAIGAALAIIAGAVYHARNLSEELKETKIELAKAQESLRVKDAKIKTDEEVLVLLRKANDALLEERDKLDEALSSLMQKPENREWGCTNLPEDITNFLSGTECKR